MLRVIGNDQNLPRQEHAVASGTLTDGKSVVVNADGTVSVVSGSSATQALGTPVVFESGTVNYNSITYDSNAQKVVIAYRDGGNSGYGTAIVGTVSGTSISFGSPVVFNSANSNFVSIAYDSNAQKVVIVYRDDGNSDNGTAIVGTVSGTSISFGSEAVFSSGIANENSIAYDSNAQKVVISYRNEGNSNYGTAVVGTVSGTSISFGTAVVFNSATSYMYYNSIAYDANAQKVVIVYSDGNNSSYGTAIVGTVSGTSISFGSEAVFYAHSYAYSVIAYDSNSQKVVIAYRADGNSYYGTAIVGTVSGTSISFGSSAVFESAETNYTSIGYDPNAQKIIISYRDETNSTYGTLAVGTVSGTSISFGTPVVYENSATTLSFVAYDSNAQKIVISHGGASSKAVVFQAGYSNTNITSENYIGISRSGAASGAGAIIDTQGAIADIPVINYVLSSASYDSVRFNSSSQDGRMSGIAFNTNGTKMYLVGTDNDSVYQYSLSTPFNVSTASYDSVTLNVSSQSVFPSAIEFNNDGTKMFIGSSNTNGVFQYSLSSGFDLSTASYDSVSFDPSSQESNVQGIQFNNDGTKMYIIGTANNTVFQYSLSTGFNLSTASYDSVSFSVASQNTTAQGLEFNNDGTKLFVVDNEPTEEVYQYDLTTGFDISTASYSNIKLDVSSQDSGTYGISFNADGSKMYLAGQDTDYIYQYSTAGSSLTAGQSYYVQNDGTLGTTAASPSVFAGTAVSATKLIVKG